METETYTITQGDSYKIPIGLSFSIDPDTNLPIPVNVTDFKLIEFVFAHLRKVYPDNVDYDITTDKFLFPVTQTETFAIKPGGYTMSIRPKFISKDVKAIQARLPINVLESPSKVVLE